MRACIQRVSSASVSIDNAIVGQIDAGYVILLGVGQNDTEAQVEKLWSKISKMRIFDDEAGKTNLSLLDVGGSVLIVSQFTLYANCKKGNRPSFTDAGAPDEANRLYELFIERAVAEIGHERVAHGSFGAHMHVALENVGPFTIWLDTDTL